LSSLFSPFSSSLFSRIHHHYLARGTVIYPEKGGSRFYKSQVLLPDMASGVTSLHNGLFRVTVSISITLVSDGANSEDLRNASNLLHLYPLRHGALYCIPYNVRY